MRRRGLGRRGPGLLGTVARTAVVAGTASAVAGGVSARQQDAAQQRRDGLDAQAQLAAIRQQEQAASARPPVDDVIAQLTQLGELRAAGVLTDDEFAAQKARILGS